MKKARRTFAIIVAAAILTAGLFCPWIDSGALAGEADPAGTSAPEQAAPPPQPEPAPETVSQPTPAPEPEQKPIPEAEPTPVGASESAPAESTDAAPTASEPAPSSEAPSETAPEQTAGAPSEEPTATPEPSPTAEAPILPPAPVVPEFQLFERSGSSDDLRLNPNGLSFSPDGLRVPELYQKDYSTTVCNVDGIPRSVSTSGCGATAVSMIVAYIARNYDQTPYTLMYKCAKNKQYNGNGLHMDVLQSLLSGYGIKSVFTSSSAGSILANMEKGRLAILNVGAGEFTSSEGHFLLLHGLDEKGRVLVQDPNSASKSRAYSAYTLEDESQFDMIVVTTQRVEPAAEVCRVTSESAPVYMKPNVNSDISVYAGRGMELRVLDMFTYRGSLWYAVSDGYILAEDVAFDEPEPTPVPSLLVEAPLRGMDDPGDAPPEAPAAPEATPAAATVPDGQEPAEASGDPVVRDLLLAETAPTNSEQPVVYDWPRSPDAR